MVHWRQWVIIVGRSHTQKRFSQMHNRQCYAVQNIPLRCYAMPNTPPTMLCNLDYSSAVVCSAKYVTTVLCTGNFFASLLQRTAKKKWSFADAAWHMEHMNISSRAYKLYTYQNANMMRRITCRSRCVIAFVTFGVEAAVPRPGQLGCWDCCVSPTASVCCYTESEWNRITYNPALIGIGRYH